MGVRTTTTITCDYLGCKGGQKGPAVVQFVQEDIKQGLPAPPEAATVITLTHGGQQFAFCKPLHAAEFFLPSGYEVKQKQVVQFPDNGNFTEAANASDLEDRPSSPGPLPG